MGLLLQGFISIIQFQFFILWETRQFFEVSILGAERCIHPVAVTFKVGQANTCPLEIGFVYQPGLIPASHVLVLLFLPNHVFIQNPDLLVRQQDIVIGLGNNHHRIDAVVFQ